MSITSDIFDCMGNIEVIIENPESSISENIEMESFYNYLYDPRWIWK